MRTISGLSMMALAIVCAPLAAQEPQSAEVRQGNSWTRALTEPAKRGTFHDTFQYVRGDKGRWSDEPRLVHAPPLGRKTPNIPLDDWFDQLLEQPGPPTNGGDDNWLLLRTRQLDDNDRVWVERVERKGNQFTVVLSQAIWQGRYFKTFTYYDVFGVNLGKLEPGKYEAKWIIRPLTFKQFTGDGRPTTMGAGRPIDNWPKDDMPTEKRPVELSVAFSVVAATSPKDQR